MVGKDIDCKGKRKEVKKGEKEYYKVDPLFW